MKKNGNMRLPPADALRQVWMLFSMEVRRFFSTPRNLVFVPLIVLGIFLVLYPYLPSPFVTIVLVTFAGMELQFNNILFRTSNEFEAMCLLPVSWKRVVSAKNLATAAVFLLVFSMTSMALLFFSPYAVTLRQAGYALLYVSTIIFPLLHAGNLRSIQHPRRAPGWQLDDLADVLVMLAMIGILSLPYGIFAEALGSPLLAILYAAATFVFWLRYSVHTIARMIEREKARLCLTD